jgi:hypothetical protein
MKPYIRTEPDPPSAPVAAQEHALASSSRKLVRRMLKLNPGMGDKVQEYADSLADSCLSPTQSLMLIEAMYSPVPQSAKGQGTRAKWFVEAVRERYGDRLVSASRSAALFKTIIAELEEVVEERDKVNGDQVSLSFHQMFMCNEAGLSADDITRLMSDQDGTPFAAKRKLLKAVEMVKTGRCATVEGALWQSGDEFSGNEDID